MNIPTQPMDNLRNQPSLSDLVDRVALIVTNLNGLHSSIINDEITETDFGGDLSELFAKLSGVEGAVSELENIFWQCDSPKEEGS